MKTNSIDLSEQIQAKQLYILDTFHRTTAWRPWVGSFS